MNPTKIHQIRLSHSQWFLNVLCRWNVGLSSQWHWVGQGQCTHGGKGTTTAWVMVQMTTSAALARSLLSKARGLSASPQVHTLMFWRTSLITRKCYVDFTSLLVLWLACCSIFTEILLPPKSLHWKQIILNDVIVEDRLERNINLI